MTGELKLGINYNDPGLLRQALTHSSYVNEHPELGLASNERLEFLGDAVLQLIVTEHLFNKCIELSEGELSRLRATVVSRHTLARRARDLQLGRFLLVGRCEEVSGGRRRPSLLEDALEALVGAAYLDGGMEPARKLVMNVLGRDIDAAVGGMRRRDFKTELQERTQRDGVLPEYVVLEESGPGHERVFRIAAIVQGRRMGEGHGCSKKEAEQEAAREALENLKEMDRDR